MFFRSHSPIHAFFLSHIFAMSFCDKACSWKQLHTIELLPNRNCGFKCNISENKCSIKKHQIIVTYKDSLSLSLSFFAINCLFSVRMQAADLLCFQPKGIMMKISLTTPLVYSSRSYFYQTSKPHCSK